MLCNGLKISEDEAYWLLDFHLGVRQGRTLVIILSFKVVCTKQTNKWKENFVILQSIGIKYM